MDCLFGYLDYDVESQSAEILNHSTSLSRNNFHLDALVERLAAMKLPRRQSCRCLFWNPTDGYVGHLLGLVEAAEGIVAALIKARTILASDILLADNLTLEFRWMDNALKTWTQRREEYNDHPTAA